MKRSIGAGAISAAAIYVFAQGSGAGVLAGYAKAISSASSISATYTIQKVGGTKADYAVQLAKPNLARIDSPGVLIVADGKTITTYNKGQKTYFKQPQTSQDLAKLMASDEVNLWAAFFDPGAYSGRASKNLGAKNRKGTTLQAIELAPGKDAKVQTIYIGADALARQAEIAVGQGESKAVYVLDTKEISLNQTPANVFAFAAPEGSREISLAEMSAGKWYTDLEEAKKVAAATGRRIFVDFFAVWCGPCKTLEAEVLSTDKFKAYSKQLVFLRIDVDIQKSVAAMFNIEAMPTQMVLTADGKIVDKIVGYGGTQMFYNWLNGALGK